MKMNSKGILGDGDLCLFWGATRIFFRSDDLCQLGGHTDYDGQAYCWFEEGILADEVELSKFPYINPCSYSLRET